MHPLLSIPELVRYIFICVTDPRDSDLLSFALVRKAWAPIALSLLWGYPTQHRLEIEGLDKLAHLVDMELKVTGILGSLVTLMSIEWL